MKYKVERVGLDAKVYFVEDPSEIEYIDNDVIGDFKRGLLDDSVDRLLPFCQMTIKTACGKIVVTRQN